MTTVMKKRVLTGINTTGTLHIGNYVGAIRPAIAASRNPDTESFFFLADLHALIKCQDPERVASSRKQIAATWLACGLDPERVTFYRQSDLPEIPLLSWFMTCSTSKGQMNRAHAYKAVVEARAGEDDVDAGVSMGLFCYPILMAADILMFNADLVPVGKDQIQHIEMARDVAARFNNTYGRPFFHLPEALVDTDHDVLPGLDGRKMSKSYNNVIPLFEGGGKALREAIALVKTDSRLPGEPKDPDSTALTRLYEAFATEEETLAFRAELADGLGWGEAKDRLFAKIDGEIGPMREKYFSLIAREDDLEDILLAGAQKARAIAAPFIEELRQAVGLRSFAHKYGDAPKPDRAAKAVLAVFKQYREGDRFFFKFVEADGTVLVQSPAYASGRDAGMAVKSLKDAPEAFAKAQPTSLLAPLGRVLEALEALKRSEEQRKALA